MKLGSVLGFNALKRFFGRKAAATGKEAAGASVAAEKVATTARMAVDKLVPGDVTATEKEAATLAARTAKESHKLGQIFEVGMQNGGLFGLVFGSESLIGGLKAQQAGLEGVAKILADQSTGRAVRMREVAGKTLEALARIEKETASKAKTGGAADLIFLLPQARKAHGEALGGLTQIAGLGGIKVELPALAKQAPKAAKPVASGAADQLSKKPMQTMADAILAARDYSKAGNSYEARKILTAAPVRTSDDIVYLARALKDAAVSSSNSEEILVKAVRSVSTARDVGKVAVALKEEGYWSDLSEKVLSAAAGRLHSGVELGKVAVALKEAGYWSASSNKILSAGARNLGGKDLGIFAAALKDAAFWSGERTEILKGATGRIGTIGDLEVFARALKSNGYYSDDTVKILAEAAGRLAKGQERQVSEALRRAGLYSDDIAKLTARQAG